MSYFYCHLTDYLTEAAEGGRVILTQFQGFLSTVAGRYGKRGHIGKAAVYIGTEQEAKGLPPTSATIPPLSKEHQ